MHVFEVELSGPLDVAASVERFRRWGDDSIDRWDGTTLVRALRTPTRIIPYACTVAGGLSAVAEAVRLAVQVNRAEDQGPVEEAIGGMFVQAPPGALAQLVASDPAVAAAHARLPGLRPVLERDPLTALVRSISAQQINLRWAATTRARLVRAFGECHAIGSYEVWSLSAGGLAAASAAAIRELQFTTRKAQYIVGVAQRVGELAALAELPDDEVIRRLTAIPGIGRWSAEWYLARTLGRPVVAAGDLGVRKAVGAAYLSGRLPSENEVRALTAHWGEAAGVAQQLLLDALKP